MSTPMLRTPNFSIVRIAMVNGQRSFWARLFRVDRSPASAICSTYPIEMGERAREAQARLESMGVFHIELEAQQEIRDRVRKVA
jgi:hypothetical protein